MNIRSLFKKFGVLMTISCMSVVLGGCGEGSAMSSATGNDQSTSSSDTVKVGILHSMSGTMAMAESPMIDATKMAIDEINEKGGVLGKKIEYVVEDGASDSAIFAEKATKLLTKDNVATVFGCWTSASRKAVLPIFKSNNGLLWYPVQYEGLESSHNIMYTAPCPNQQAIPAIDYIVENIKPKDGNKLKVFLIGSDYVYPRTTNTIIKAMAPSYGFDIAGEEYIPLGHTDLSTVITKVKQINPDVIINTINGDSNVAFFKQYKDAGISPEDIPTMSFSCYEEDVRGMGASYAEGHLFAWNYFQTVDSEANKAFVDKFKSLYGSDKVTGDPIENAYAGVYLWAEACEKAGTFNVDDVIKACETGEIEVDAPEGKVTIAAGDSHHTIQNVLVGKCNSEGQMDIVWETSERVEPDPWLKSYDWAKDAGLGN